MKHKDVFSFFSGVFEYVLKEFKRIDILVNNAGSVCEQNPKKIIELNLVRILSFICLKTIS